MTVTFLHTADWQLGKPFASTENDDKRILMQQERLNVLARIAATVKTTDARFVLVAGDLFDSSSTTKSTVSKACSAIGDIGVPVIAIPGNHDHGGPGSVWEQEFFLRESEQLAPNFRILRQSGPVELEDVVILACPLGRRHESADTTTWIRTATDSLATFGNKPRIVLAHGSVQGFTSSGDDDGADAGAPNQIALDRLPVADLDYIALGDWHGTKQVGQTAWYSGTPEQDRFAKGDDYSAGNVLTVTVRRGVLPVVTAHQTGRIGWHRIEHAFGDDGALAQLELEMSARLATRAGEDLLRLELSGSLGMTMMTRLEQMIESWTARLLRLRLVNRTTVAPTEDEINQMANSGADPLIARVAGILAERARADGDEAEVSRIALRELFAIGSARNATV